MRSSTLRVAAGLFLLILLATAAPSLAQESKQLYWQRWDADVAINTDGSFAVTETQEIVFTSGSFRFGTRNIKTDRLRDITAVQVTADGQALRRASSGETAGTFVVSSNASGDFVIKWFFPASVSDSRHVYVLKYVVDGALRYYDGGDQFWWSIVGPERSFPVRSSTVTVRVPAPATVSNFDNYGVRGTATQLDAQTVEFASSDVINAGEQIEVRVQFTHGVVAGAPAAWQAQADADAADAEARAAYDRQIRPLLNTGLLALGLLFLIGGPLLVYLLWYQRGRDLPVALPTDYLAEPPDPALPPGIAGTLVDESADLQDVIATLIDLARRKVLTIREEKDKDFTYTLVGKTDTLRPFEQTLIARMFTGNQTERQLSELKNKFYTTIPKVKAQLYDEVVREGFFTRSPERTRNAYGAGGVALLVLTGILGFCGLPFVIDRAEAAWFPVFGLGVTSLIFMSIARFMPRKTDKGAEAAARWRAFKRYLQEIEKYTNLAESKAIFETYLPFAVAFGLDRTWINKFAQVDAPAPTWWIPYPSYGSGPYRDRGPMMGGGSANLPGGGHVSAEGRSAPPTLSDMSRGLGGGLSSMSAGLGTMLSASAATLTSRPAPPPSSGSSSSGWSGGGGGWSGGGGFSGGGGGGGGGGFG